MRPGAAAAAVPLKTSCRTVNTSSGGHSSPSKFNAVALHQSTLGITNNGFISTTNEMDRRPFVDFPVAARPLKLIFSCFDKSISMTTLRVCKGNFQLWFLPTHFNLPKSTIGPTVINYYSARPMRKSRIVACTGGEKKSETRSFLSLEEAGLIEVSGLSSHERFLCRLTISSLNLLKVMAEQEGCSIEELNAGRVCDWFLKDKLKREQNLESAVLQWEDDPQFEF